MTGNPIGITDGPGIVIAGGGLAAVRTAQTLRTLGYAGKLRMFCDEPHPPYDRPPLSKDYLTGEVGDDEVRLLSLEAADALGLDITLSAKVIGLERDRRLIALADGSQAGYELLVIATGARARQLPGLTPTKRIHYLRSVDDARAVAQALSNARQLLVVGSGFIGLEVASSARALGLDVEVVAADDGPMVGIIGKQLSDWLMALHSDRGVRMRSAVTVWSVVETASQVTVRLSDDSIRQADVVVVGAGVSRELDWLSAAGLEVDAAGVVCDRAGRTSDRNIFAVGDIARGCQHWTAAADSARRAAHAIVGAEPPPDTGDDFFWTEQHGHRLQFVGTADVEAELEVLTGSPDDGAFVAELRSAGVVTGIFASNSPRDFLKHRLAFTRSEKR